METVDLLSDMGYRLQYQYHPENRVGDHICYISDLTKLRNHFPAWKLQYDVARMTEEIVAHQAGRLGKTGLTAGIVGGGRQS